MNSSTRMLAGAVALFLVQGCASSGGGTTAAASESAPSRANSRVSRSLITREELQEHNFENAYEAVESLRSNWLEGRGLQQSSASGTPVLVYLDQSRLGDVNELKTVPIRQVKSIRHLNGIEATARYGLEHVSGAIVVTTQAPNPILSDSAAVRRAPR